METNAARDRDYELWGLLNQASHAMERAREDELRPLGLSMMHAAVLYIVKVATDPVTPAQISRWLFREPHSVSGLLQRMEKQGLVKRAKDLERKNVIRVTLTEQGEEAYRRSTEMKPIHRIMSHLSPEENDSLRASLKTLRDKALQEHRRGPRWSFI
jgi:DNA-binding MarR family transcriptional regulator